MGYIETKRNKSSWFYFKTPRFSCYDVRPDATERLWKSLQYRTHHDEDALDSYLYAIRHGMDYVSIMDDILNRKEFQLEVMPQISDEDVDHLLTPFVERGVNDEKDF